MKKVKLRGRTWKVGLTSPCRVKRCMHVWVQTSADLCDAVASPNTSIDICKAVEWCEAAERKRSPVGFDFCVAIDIMRGKGYNSRRKQRRVQTCIP